MPNPQANINFDATAELFRRGQLVLAHPLKPPYTLEVLVSHVMSKRVADRQIYSFMVGDRVFHAPEIEQISKFIELNAAIGLDNGTRPR